MVTNDISGNFVTLRSVEESDAEFALGLRQLPKALKYMPPLNISVAQQTAWIKKQRELEGDYFFVACNKLNMPVGVLSVYDVSAAGNGKAEVGRVVMQGKSFESLESWLLLLEFSFVTLNLNEVTAYVHPDNARAIRFYKFFGGVDFTETSTAVRSFPFKEIRFNAKNLSAHKPEVVKKIFSSSSRNFLGE